MPQYRGILRDYLDRHAMPAMLAQGGATKAAKTPDYAEAQRAGYHIEQPLRTHIVNGLFAITRVLEYLDAQGYYHLREAEFKRFQRTRPRRGSRSPPPNPAAGHRGHRNTGRDKWPPGSAGRGTGWYQPGQQHRS